MTQTVAVDVPLGPARTGLAIGCIVYALDGSTVVSAFDVTGWYEASPSSGDWHHPGVTGPDAGGVIAVGISGTEYKRQAFEAVQTSAGDVVAALMAYALESGKTVKEAWLDIWSVTVGDGEADDANNPTQEMYKSPDGTVQVTHAQTATTRTNV